MEFHKEYYIKDCYNRIVTNLRKNVQAYAVCVCV
jgi:hypothetical protein